MIRGILGWVFFQGYNLFKFQFSFLVRFLELLFVIQMIYDRYLFFLFQGLCCGLCVLFLNICFEQNDQFSCFFLRYGFFQYQCLYRIVVSAGVLGVVGSRSRFFVGSYIGGRRVLDQEFQFIFFNANVYLFVWVVVKIGFFISIYCCFYVYSYILVL